MPNENNKPIKIAFDDDGEVLDIKPSMEELCQKVGVNIKNEDGTYKCWGDILNELSRIWNKL